MKYTDENYKNAKSGDLFEFTCPVCGTKFYRTKRSISKNNGIVPKYCSQRCSRIEHAKQKIKIICEECGKEYEIDKCVYERKLRNGTKFFCSRSCAASYNNKVHPKRTKETTSEICPICGGIKNSCSGVCKKCYNNERLNYVLNRELGYYIGYDKRLPYITSRCTEIRKVARKLMEEDKTIEKVCAICHNHEFDPILEVHHIKGIKEFDPRTKISIINSKENLIWVCPNHHRMIELGLIKI